MSIEIRNVSKNFGDFRALRDVSLDIASGELVALLGPSGCGKTTLLRIIAGLETADAGSILFAGEDTTDVHVRERQVGFVFQHYALFRHMTVFENVAFPLRMRKAPEDVIRREVTEVLDMVQLGHTAQRLPRGLSGGQQQRIALARAFVFKPHIILMDEPLGALDKKLRDQLQLEIKNIHLTHKTTILYVTHDQGEALTMSDRICLMNNGRIEQLDTPSQLYFRPKTVFAADFLGDSNFIDGMVRTSAGGDTEIEPDAAKSMTLRGIGESLPSASRVRMMVRPERLALADDVPEGWNALPVTVKQSIFVGGFTRHYCTAPNGLELVALELTAGPGSERPVGQETKAIWPDDSAVVLADDKGSES